MFKQKYQVRVEKIRNCLKGKLNNRQAATELDCTSRTIQRYKRRFLAQGPQGLIDYRGSNHRKLTATQIYEIKSLKKEGPWRSCRHIRDKLNLPVTSKAVWDVLRKANLMHLNAERLKPLRRFVAKHPNDLWQSDIMGKMKFPHLGYIYLIATIDDHSRFILSSNWYLRQTKQNVFFIWYSALRKWGKPKGMLQDRGSQYKANTQFGQSDYQYYAQLLGIKLIWAKRAQTKGKIERLWRFVQQDFVRENLEVRSVEELNKCWSKWVAWYNFRWRGNARGLDGRTPVETYQVLKEGLKQEEIEHLLVIEERRKVTRESTISLYGKKYRIPLGYIGCRIWVKIRGNKLLFEANGEVFWKQRLKL
jgi:transposase